MPPARVLRRSHVPGHPHALHSTHFKYLSPRNLTRLRARREGSWEKQFQVGADSESQKTSQDQASKINLLHYMYPQLLLGFNETKIMNNSKVTLKAPSLNTLKNPPLQIRYIFGLTSKDKSMSNRKGLRVLLILRKASLAETGNEIPLRNRKLGEADFIQMAKDTLKCEKSATSLGTHVP